MPVNVRISDLRIVADVGYDPGKNDLQSEAKRLQAKLGIVENQTPVARPSPPVPPVDGVFLPEAADRLNLLISYLAFVDIRGVLCSARAAGISRSRGRHTRSSGSSAPRSMIMIS